MAHKLNQNVAKALHEANKRKLKPIDTNEGLSFDDLTTPRCQECGSDLEETLFSLECPKCEKREQ